MNNDEEEHFYSKKAREKLIEKGALSNEEEGFMRGYEEYDELAEEQDSENFDWDDDPDIYEKSFNEGIF